MLERLNRITAWQAALVIVVIGFSVFSFGLSSPFQGDDLPQITNNPVVHSISNIKLFFEGGTFYNGGGIAPLGSSYYRPLMTATFSLIYTLFGPHAYWFHLIQLLLYIGCAILMFLIFRYSFGTLLSLVLSLAFLVHPLNSQVVYAIPSMQDVLFFFFGALAFWLLLRYKSIKSLGLVALCLFLSLLSKEAGGLFMVMALVYLGIFDRRRLMPFAAIMTLPVISYLALRNWAVGGTEYSKLAPIAGQDLGSRLLTAPSVISFFIFKFMFPWKLASAYYWTYPHFSFQHVLLPIIIDIASLALITYVAFAVHRRVPKAQFYTYIFFALWTVCGLLPYLQIIPLDMTVSETWFCFSMVGVLGIVGTVLLAFQAKIKPSWFLVGSVLIIGLLGARTAFRSTDWSSAYTLAKHDIAVSKENYNAYNDIAGELIIQGKYKEASQYAARSASIFPNYNNYANLGLALTDLGDYPKAVAAYNRGVSYGPFSLIYENAGRLALVYGDFGTNRKLPPQRSAKISPRLSYLDGSRHLGSRK